MCCAYDHYFDIYASVYPTFKKTYQGAIHFARKQCLNNFHRVHIFLIPFDEEACIDDSDHCVMENRIITVYEPLTAAAMVIQKWWKCIYQKRVDAANIIKEAVREAIANPNTQLCRNRLLREFNGM